MARAQPMVPSKTVTHRSPPIVMICKISSNATKAPTRGVHRPGMRRSPNPVRNAEIIVVLTSGLLHSAGFARRSSAAPRMTRMRSKPMPGQPPANVEYRRRKNPPFDTPPVSCLAKTERNPKESRYGHSLEFNLTARNQPADLEVDDSSFQPNHCGLRSIIGTQF